MLQRFIVLSLVLTSNFGFSQLTQSDALGHEKWEYILEDAGDVLQILLPVAAGSITLLKEDYEGTKQFALSYGATLALTYSLKYLTQKQRPEGRLSYDSFPSGHTASAFSGASFIQRRYGWKMGWPGYVLATLVGVSRMEGPDGYHDHWDVLGGAVIGIGSTYLFTKKQDQPKMSLGFSSGSGTYLISFKASF